MSDRWQRYYAAIGEAPRDTLLEALARHEAEDRSPGFAVDLGCGSGRDTLELLRRGWSVLAIDAEARAFELLRAHPDAVAAGERLTTSLRRFEDIRWPDADLVNASFALPFCPQSAFAVAWLRIRESLRPGGRFSGQLFGERDEWAPAPDMAFHTRSEVHALLAGLDVERLDEVEEDGQTAVGNAKHWHLFSIVARRRE